MPRKSVKAPVETAPESLPVAPPEATPEPKKRAVRKKTSEDVVVVAPAPEEAPAPKRERKKKDAAPEPVAEAAPKRGRKKKEEAPAPEPVTAPEVPAQTPEEDEVPEGIVVTVRPRASATPIEATPVEATPAPVEEAEPDFLDGIVVSVRPRTQAALEPAPAPGRDEPDYPLLHVEVRPLDGRAPADLALTDDAGVPLPAFETRPVAGRAPAAPMANAPAPFAQDEDGLDLPPVSFRRTGSSPAPQVEETDEETEPTPVEAVERRGRRRRGRGGRPVEEDAFEEVAEIEADEEPAAVVAPAPSTRIVERKPVPLSIPADAPQVVVRDGVPTLVRDGRAYPPIFFFSNPSDERRLATVLEEVRMAAESGVHVHVLMFPFEVDVDKSDLAVQYASLLLERVVAVDPEAQVLFRLLFEGSSDWTDRFADARYRTRDGATAPPSVCDDRFWGVARDALTKFVAAVRRAPHADHVMGLHLDRGEWFLPRGTGYDDSRAAERAFRDWARARYHRDAVALRASWFDGSAEFDILKIPTYQPQGGEGERFVRMSRKQRPHVDYHLFLSDATVGRIQDLARAAKVASEGRFLVGVSYGYTFEWSHPASGHLALGKLLRCQEVDYVAGPPSYRDREPGGTASFPGPIDSFALNGKLYVSEEDFKTSLGFVGSEPDDDYNPAMKSPQALESVHLRGMGAALAHGSGVSWMDVWGNGWLKTHSVWSRAREFAENTGLRMATPGEDPELAVFIDERSLAYLVDPDAFRALVQDVREAVLRAGVSAAFYLLSDLAHRERFPESKAYLFVNAWDLRPELRAAIKSRLQCDGKVLFWLYAAGLFDSGRDALDRVREVTGIAIKPQPFHSRPGTTLLHRRHPLTEAFPSRKIASDFDLEPSYFAVPEGATVLGEYEHTGLPSFVVRHVDDDPKNPWTSVFLGEPVMTPDLVRAIAGMAGAHVWDFTNDVVHVRPPFLSVHCTGAGPRTLALPDKAALYDLGSRQFVAEGQSQLRFSALDGSTHSFLVGPRAELEHLLKTDLDAVRRVDALPPRDLNIRTEEQEPDVPIVSLAEFVSGGENLDSADEWFLRASAVRDETPVVEQATEEAPGRRKRRRGRGDRGDGPAQNVGIEDVEATEVASFDDLGLAVAFRRRS